MKKEGLPYQIVPDCYQIQTQIEPENNVKKKTKVQLNYTLFSSVI